MFAVSRRPSAVPSPFALAPQRATAGRSAARLLLGTVALALLLGLGTQDAVPAQAAGPRLVLADYLPWYDNWDDCRIVRDDKPRERYHSDDGGAIGRHVEQAAGAGIDGFVVHWVSPGDRTDNNLAQVLDRAAGRPFYATVYFEYPYFSGLRSAEEVAGALRQLIDRHMGHPNWLRWQGKPVVFFGNMPRIGTAPGQSPLEAWRWVRDQVDPGRGQVWMAEGQPAYLRVFDGLYYYKVTHAPAPNAFLGQPRWAAQARAWGQRGRPKLWAGTAMPGWDDVQTAACGPDAREASPAFRRDPEGGAFYRRTWDAALRSRPDMVFISSFNEWAEGHYIEPSERYGDLFLGITRELSGRYKR